MEREDQFRLTLFIPGTPASLESWDAKMRCSCLRVENGMLRGDDLSKSLYVGWVDNDGEFGKAFSFGTVEPSVIREIDEAPGALVLNWQVDLRDGREEVCTVIRKLRSAGALAVRIEESKMGWEVSRWLELFTSDDPWDWHRAAVTFLKTDDMLQSCGMHVFSLPDARIFLDGDASDLQYLASSLNVYQIAENPLLLAGQTFSTDSETARRVIERWPDGEYPPNHLCHNPYGIWRLGPPGGIAVPQDKLSTVFTPSLYAQLKALESKVGQQLSKEQVEDVRDNGSCIAVEHRDAQKLERSRGYADLDPELVWEQWQLVKRRA